MKQLLEHAIFETSSNRLHVMIYDTDRKQRYFGSYVVTRLAAHPATGKAARGIPVGYGTVESSSIAELDAACRDILRKFGGRILRERDRPVVGTAPVALESRP
ncbi:MAG: hypothetical protein J0H82_11210 [Alphaproteobacteria bacterium]|jgi:hypothetical protein|nr:hypothetical protein [Alphaproteobacteria bacterium]